MSGPKRSGRPPLKYSEEDVIRMGEELLNWVEENKNNKEIVHLSQWWVNIMKLDRHEWKCLCDRYSFAPYYEKSLEMMHVKTLLNDKLPIAYGSRYLGIYSQELRDHEREIIEHKMQCAVDAKADLASKVGSVPNDGILSDLLGSVKNLKHD